MPWEPKDVDAHKKGLTPEQKKKWCSVANAILKDCIAKGGTDKTCAPKAIRIANSKFSDEGFEFAQGTLEDYEYLLHHIEVDDKGKETIHHCLIYDHIANMFEQEHLIVVKGRVFLGNKEIKEGVFHVINDLEPTQEVCWSDTDAEENDIAVKEMVPGMTYKQKAKEW